MAQPNTVSNIRSVIAQLCRNTKQGTNVLNTVFSESQDYREIIESFRKQATTKSRSDKTFPLLAHSRTPLRYAENIGKRIANEKYSLEYNGSDIQIQIVYAAFDFNFSYITTSPVEAENFEQIYLLYKGLTKKEHVISKALVFDEDFEYDLDFTELTDNQLNLEANKYFILQGSAIIKGPFIIITGEADIIKEINIDYKNLSGVEYT